jgi:putative acetyltransferase
MKNIRQATEKDLSRIAEIEIFNYRLNFYPIFRDDEYYFDTMRVSREAEMLKDHLQKIYVYDDGAVKGYVMVYKQEIVHLFVEPVLQGQGIGQALLWFAVEVMGCTWLWALEKNEGAIRFYRRNGFVPTGEKELEEDTDEYLIRMEKM